MSWESLARVEAVECRTAGDVKALARRYAHLSTKTPVVHLVKETPEIPAEVAPKPIPIVIRNFPIEPVCPVTGTAIITMSAINFAVCKFYRVLFADLTGHGRTHRIVLPRQVAMYLTRHLTILPLTQIGARMGGRDHTTALSAIRKIERLLATDPVLAGQIEYLRRELGA
jgi:chromosomal replication initiator protein